MESWMPLFVAVIAIAVVLQSIFLIAMFIQMRRTAARVEQVVTDISGKVAPLISSVQVLVDDISPRITGIVADASEITRLARGEVQKVDRIVSEALERLRMQLIHVDHILTGAIETVEQAGSQIRQTVWGPVVKATAMLRGVQAGIDFLRNVRGRRDGGDIPADQQDEGMFI
ncbi:MAG TPA: DUF948 domain-containing protein [Candidatus Acidoferrales bacterium]|jgi:hypothetical protein|nr:DUF948 domain-containing protein [Candidatus Acidoferrales bacterium]